MDAIVAGADLVARETTLFAAVGLLIGGIDDLAIDLLFLGRRLRHRGDRRLSLERLPAPLTPGRIVIMVPAWDEAAVIGDMLRTALGRYEHPDYRIHVGLYPNDPATIAAVQAVAATDGRVRPVIGPHAGPTTKADCLNALWHDLRQTAAADGTFVKAVVLHDAEDVVHPAELTVFDALIDRYDVVQLPVLPLVKSGSQLVSGHYADEFAEAHLKQMVVRTALGAGMPLAGTGCAIAVPMVERIAGCRGGDPFDADSLTEDYEFGLRIAELGGRGLFARVGDGTGPVVAARAYFPADVRAAVRQKARWMTGIALAGWDRTGWGRPLAFTDHWMRMRDRRAPLAVLVLMAAYLALLAWPVSVLLHWAQGSAPLEPSPILSLLLRLNAVLLGWRLLVRATVTARVYGMAEAIWSAPRLLVGNVVALLAARRAVWTYLGMLRGRTPAWDKTRHDFPDLPEVPVQ